MFGEIYFVEKTICRNMKYENKFLILELCSNFFFSKKFTSHNCTKALSCLKGEALRNRKSIICLKILNLIKFISSIKPKFLLEIERQNTN